MNRDSVNSLTYKEQIRAYRNQFENELFERVIPFWERHSPDREYGGYFNCLDRDGGIYDRRKYSWLQGRQSWLFSTIYRTVEARPEWLHMARAGIRFLRDHALQADGRVFFSLTHDGRPAYLQRKIFSECFYIMALAGYHHATGEESWLNEAKEELEKVWEWSSDPAALGRPVMAGQAPISSLAVPMILLNLIEEITSGRAANYDQQVRECIRRILLHVHQDKKTVFETVGRGGEPSDDSEGRLLNPGHAIEAGWFLQHWAQRLQDTGLSLTASQMVRWSHDIGWDPDCGGLFYFVDYRGYSPVPLEWSMKLWWPHCEAMYGHLLNHRLTGSDKDWRLFRLVTDYAFAHFPDPEHGEWYGYLDRRGTVTHRFKGGPYKGCFHVPRGLWLCWKVLKEMEMEPEPAS